MESNSFNVLSTVDEDTSSGSVKVDACNELVENNRQACNDLDESSTAPRVTFQCHGLPRSTDGADKLYFQNAEPLNIFKVENSAILHPLISE